MNALVIRPGHAFAFLGGVTVASVPFALAITLVVLIDARAPRGCSSSDQCSRSRSSLENLLEDESNGQTRQGSVAMGSLEELPEQKAPRATAANRGEGQGLVAATTTPARATYRQMADAAATLCGVPKALFRSLISRESSWRMDVVSSAGAVGMSQIKPSTARELSPTLNIYTPFGNAVAGACHLRRLYDLSGSWRSALHDYNAGRFRKTTSRKTIDYANDILEGAE